MATKQELEDLQAEVARLQAALLEEQGARSAAEEAARAVAAASPFVDHTVEEQPTGKTVPVEVCLNPGARKESEHRFHTVEMPTYFYTIQLPAAAGLSLSTNGVEYYHGQTYEFDPIMLAEMKSRVARCWDHEKSIHGDNENAYRKPMNKSLISAAAAARRGH